MVRQAHHDSHLYFTPIHMLQIGDTAPNFSAPDQNNTMQTLEDQKGNWVLLYFYPKDDTSGCTKEACGIRDNFAAFKKEGITVFGVSKDPVKSHKKFEEKYDLPFTLISDESTEINQAYGAWQEKSMYGKKYMGTARISYLIDPKGKIAKVYPKVKAGEHAEEVLKDVK